MAASAVPNTAGILEKARAKRAEVQEASPVDIVIPNTGGLIFGRYKPLDYKTLRRVGKKYDKPVANDPDAEANAEISGATEILSLALIEFLVKDEDDKLVRIDPSTPVRYKEIAQHLEIDTSVADSDRFIVGELMGDDLTLMTHYAKYAEETGQVDQDADEEVFTS